MHMQETAQQSQIERAMLFHITEGMRATIALPTHGTHFGQKLSTLRFIAQSFQRHLEHIMALEENDGYMTIVLESSPQFGRRVDALRNEHELFRRATSRIVHRLEHVASNDKIRFTHICEEIEQHLQQVERHFEAENALVQEAIERDGGGEG